MKKQIKNILGSVADPDPGYGAMLPQFTTHSEHIFSKINRT
jgi:hypothetical protein